MAMLEKIIGVIAPHTCILCGEEGKLLCAWCMPDACMPVPDICYRCHTLSPDGVVCQKCRPKTSLRYVKIHTNYEGAALELVRLMKFERAQAAAQLIAGLMRESLPFLGEDTLVTHIPAATTRVRLRGYDQSKLLAKHLARHSGRHQATLLARLGQSRQVGASRERRLLQMDGAFRPVNHHLIKGVDIVLVDDVLTTGATLEEAARILKRAGAKNVNAIVFAHKR